MRVRTSRSAGLASMLGALLLPCLAWANSPPQISNVTAQQRVGTFLVDIRYDVFDADGDPLGVSVFLSIDGGATFPIACTSVTGAVGEGVTSGTGRTIVWNAGLDYPGFDGSTCSIRVVADDHVVAIHDRFLVLVDLSGSMTTQAGPGSRYDAVVASLSAFLTNAQVTGALAGLNFFPVSGAVDQCDTTLYTPAQLAPVELPGGASTLQAALLANAPAGGSPTFPALQGSLHDLVADKLAHPDDVDFAILLTDGAASLCETSVPATAGLAAAAFGAGVRTFVVGLDATNFSDLNQIATSGGGTATLISSANMRAELFAALQAIYATATGP